MTEKEKLTELIGEMKRNIEAMQPSVDAAFATLSEETEKNKTLGAENDELKRFLNDRDGEIKKLKQEVADLSEKNKILTDDKASLLQKLIGR